MFQKTDQYTYLQETGNVFSHIPHWRESPDEPTAPLARIMRFAPEYCLSPDKQFLNQK